MQKHWNSPIYAFYSKATIKYSGTRLYHNFACVGKGCNTSIRRYQDTGDAKSTGNLRRHADTCWGKAAVNMAVKAGDVVEARTKVVNGILKTGSITASFEILGKKKVTYSNIQHTRQETR